MKYIKSAHTVGTDSLAEALQRIKSALEENCSQILIIRTRTGLRINHDWSSDDCQDYKALKP